MICLRAMPSCLARSRSKAVLAAPATGAEVNLTKKISPRTPNSDFPARVITRTQRTEPLGVSVTGDSFSLFGISEGDDESLLVDIWSSSFRPFSEDGTSHPHEGCTFLYGNFKVVTHSHR